MDVNYQILVGPPGAQVGGRLNNFVNIPAEWLTYSTAAFDSLKIEALAFGSSMRNLDLALAAITSPLPLAWPGRTSDIWFRYSAQRRRGKRVVGLASTSGYSVVNLWALDHICWYGWDFEPGAFTTTTRSSY